MPLNSGTADLVRAVCSCGEDRGLRDVCAPAGTERGRRYAEPFAPYHVMDRVGDPNEIAAAVVFLASNAASFITGVNLPVDGGLLLGFWANKTGP